MIRMGGAFIKKTLHSAAVATADGETINLLSESGGCYQTVTLQVSGISGDTVTFQGTIDGTNWVTVSGTNLNSAGAGTTATANGLYRINVLGFSKFRATLTRSAGTVTVTAVATTE